MFTLIGVGTGTVLTILGRVLVFIDASNEFPIFRRVGVIAVVKVAQSLTIYGEAISRMIQIGDQEKSLLVIQSSLTLTKFPEQLTT